jgi:hypothetical protein
MNTDEDKIMRGKIMGKFAQAAKTIVLRSTERQNRSQG